MNKFGHKRIFALQHVYHVATNDDAGVSCVNLWCVKSFIGTFPEIDVRILGWDLSFLVEQVLGPLGEFFLILIQVTFEFVFVDLGNIAKTIDNLSNILAIFKFLDDIVHTWSRSLNILLLVEWHLTNHDVTSCFTLHV